MALVFNRSILNSFHSTSRHSSWVHGKAIWGGERKKSPTHKTQINEKFLNFIYEMINQKKRNDASESHYKFHARLETPNSRNWRLETRKKRKVRRAREVVQKADWSRALFTQMSIELKEINIRDLHSREHAKRSAIDNNWDMRAITSWKRYIIFWQL